MKAGQTNLKVGTKVQIINQDREHKHLEGLIGEVTHPFAFGCTKKNWIGIWLDKEGVVRGDNCNVKTTEIKIL